MKKIVLLLTLLANIHSITKAQQPMTISPGLNIGSPTAGVSGLRFNNLNSGTTVSTTPTKVLSLDATGNVILGNSASGGSSQWGVDAVNNRLTSTGYTGGIDVAQIVFNSPSSVISPLLFSKGSASSFLRYGGASGNFALVQESNTGFNFGSTNISWKYYDNANPQGITDMFGYASNTFSVNGGQSISGNSTIGGNSTVSGTSAVSGKVTVGSSTTTTAGMEIRASTSTDANPDIYFKGTNNVLRFGNNTDGASIVQTTNSAATTGASTITWKYLNNAATPVANTMMTLDGDGDLGVNGFTKFGNTATSTTAGITTSQPAIKTILFTGTITANASPETSASLTTAIPHGLNADKIVDIKVLLKGLGNNLVAEGFTDNRPTTPLTGYQFTTLTDPTNIYILRTNGNSANLAQTNLRATYRVFITYIP
jgi:hypothetical protein